MKFIYFSWAFVIFSLVLAVSAFGAFIAPFTMMIALVFYILSKREQELSDKIYKYTLFAIILPIIGVLYHMIVE